MMKKKLWTGLLGLLLCAAAVSAAPMNPSTGYKDLPWGSTVKQAQKAGYKLSLIGEDMAAPIKRLYTEPVDVYFVAVKEKDVESLFFVYYQDKFFAAYEELSAGYNSLKKVQSRYGKQMAYDQQLGMYTDGVAALVRFPMGTGMAQIYDKAVMLAISAVGRDAAQKTAGGTASGDAGFVSQFDSLAQKLLQESKTGGRASYAFLGFTTDNGNSLMERYVTDALTEAVFNTGSVRIIERSDIERILTEQQFQSSGLVDESAAARIGAIAGVDYVCYGTIKENGSGLTVTARVVDVESGEICAMSRAAVTKDDYLTSVSGTAPASAAAPVAAPKPVTAHSLWQYTANRNEFDGYTTYTFTLRGPGNEFLFMGYDKYDEPAKSRVRAGSGGWGSGSLNGGAYDIKTEAQGTISKKYSYAAWSPQTGWINGKNALYFCYYKSESARFFVTLFEENSYLTLRHDNVVRRFQTQGFWDTVESAGLTRQEISDAIANEEF